MICEKKYLPIGTVILLKEGKKKLMVIGFAAATENAGEVYDYVGCLYPEGVISSEETLAFNHDQIESIYRMGEIDEEVKVFHQKLDELVQYGSNSSDDIESL